MILLTPSAKPALVWKEGGREGGRKNCKWNSLCLDVEKETHKPPPSLPPSLSLTYPSVIQTAAGDGLEAIEGREEGQLLHDLVLDVGIVQDELRGGREVGREGKYKYKHKQVMRHRSHPFLPSVSPYLHALGLEVVLEHRHDVQAVAPRILVGKEEGREGEKIHDEFLCS
jgi:hypothetical protein